MKKQELISDFGKIINEMRKVKEPTALASITESNPFKVLVSTILSQRARDEMTIVLSRNLLSKYPTAEKLAKASIRDVEKIIRKSGFYHTKAKRVVEVSQIMVEKYRGRVPRKIEELLELPGVGRKTANCVLVFGYHLPAIPVDTHVHRISNRLGLVSTKTPEQTEIELSNRLPEKYWMDVNDNFVRYGRNVCRPIGPRCGICRIKKLCKYYHSANA